MSDSVGLVAELWRFPVKSMQGEQLHSVTFGTAGMIGDRAWAAVAADTGKVLSAKTQPRLLDAAARTDAETGSVTIELPDGTVFGAADPSASDQLSAYLGKDIRLEPAVSSSGAAYEMTFDPPNDEAELYEIPINDGTFFDLCSFHLLTTASLETWAERAPSSTWDRRRFRPNLLVETSEPGERPEDEWVGHALGVGDAVLQVDLRTVRCALPLRAQPALGDEPPLERDVDIFRTLSAGHDNHLGVYGSVTAPGRVTVGDAITLS